MGSPEALGIPLPAHIDRRALIKASKDELRNWVKTVRTIPTQHRVARATVKDNSPAAKANVLVLTEYFNNNNVAVSVPQLSRLRIR